jgi:hypothetical protein
MASAYATLANDGIRCEAFAIAKVEAPKINAPGWRDLYVHEPQCEQVIDPDIAHLVSAMLQRVVTSGTGTAAGIGRPVAGKTGTAQDYSNVYFAGYTPQVATAVWVGFPSGQIPMDDYYNGSVFGGTVAAPIWQAFMSRAMQEYPVEGFEAAPAPERGRVPDVVGLKSDEAQALLVEANFSPVVEKVDSFEPVNTVLSQTPGGGASAVLGSAVHLTVSNGKGEPVTVPRVTGLAEDDAARILRHLGLEVAVEDEPVDDPALDGIVIRQSPIGDGRKVVDVGSTVTIVVGRFGGDGGDGGNGGGDGGGGDGGNGDGGGEEPPAVPAAYRPLLR